MLFRIVLGFLLAPLAPGMLVDFIATVEVWPYGWARFGIATAAVLGHPVALLFGVPAYLFFQRRGWVAFSTYVGAGAVLGVVPFAFFFVPPAVDCASGAASDSHACLVLATMAPAGIYSTVAGAVAASAFWFIVRPDKALRSTG